MDVRALEQFVAVAEELNVTRAARRLYAAQSTVSAGLRSLERELGATLLERSTRRVALTPAGERVLPEARAVLAAYDRLRDRATEDRDGQLRGRVRLGAFAGLDLLGLPALVREFREDHPLVDLALVVSPSGSQGLNDDLRRGRLDLAFSSLVDDSADLASQVLAEMPFVALLPPDHALAGRSRLRLDDLVDEAWVDTGSGFGNRVVLDTVLQRRGLSRRLVVELGDLPSVSRYVAAGVGVAVVPDAVEAPGCVRLPVAEPLLPLWRLAVCWRSDAPPSPAATELVRRLGETTARRQPA